MKLSKKIEKSLSNHQNDTSKTHQTETEQFQENNPCNQIKNTHKSKDLDVSRNVYVEKLFVILIYFINMMSISSLP